MAPTGPICFLRSFFCLPPKNHHLKISLREVTFFSAIFSLNNHSSHFFLSGKFLRPRFPITSSVILKEFSEPSARVSKPRGCFLPPQSPSIPPILPPMRSRYTLLTLLVVVTFLFIYRCAISSFPPCWYLSPQLRKIDFSLSPAFFSPPPILPPRSTFLRFDPPLPVFPIYTHLSWH